MRRSVSVSNCVRSAIEACPRCAPALSVTGKRPAASVTLSINLPCASVMLNACTSCKLGPRVGVSFTLYAFNPPRSATTTRELDVISRQSARRENAHTHLYSEFAAAHKIASKNLIVDLARGARAFLFAAHRAGQFIPALLPRFVSRLRLRSADKPQQTGRTLGKIDIVTRRKFFRPREKSLFLIRIEN